jgi:SAM-dependent methyltransferase
MTEAVKFYATGRAGHISSTGSLTTAELAVPAIFAGAREYRGDPAALEAAQATFNEEALYQAIAGFAADWYRRTHKPPHVLDLCSATGLAAHRVAQVIPVTSLSLVDIDPIGLAQAEQRFYRSLPASAFCEDAVTFASEGPYDLILMNSAYHHIEDNRKVTFLRNAASLLAVGGEIFVGEHFVPDYHDDEYEYRQALVVFYTALIRELEARGEPAQAIDVIRRSGLYGWEGVYEYKTSLRHFELHARQAMLPLEIREIWLPEEQAKPRKAGTMAVRIMP